LRLEELFTVDTEAAVEEFRARCAELSGPCTGQAPAHHLQIIQDPEYKRFGSRYSIGCISVPVKIL
jgi:hypothetical protein